MMTLFNNKTAREWYDKLVNDKAYTFQNVPEWEHILRQQYQVTACTELALRLSMIELSEILKQFYDPEVMAYEVATLLHVNGTGEL